MSEITLPSGLRGRMRAISAKEARVLFDAEKFKKNEVEDELLHAAWEETLDPGPYKFSGGKLDLDKILVGDHVVAMVCLRNETYPDDLHVMSIRCANPMCKKLFQWELDVGELLKEKVRPLAKDDVAVLAAGNQFQGLVPRTSIPFTFRLVTCGDAKSYADYQKSKKTKGNKRLQDQSSELINPILPFIVNIGGKTQRADIFDALESLPMPSLRALRPMIDSHNCGLDTTIDVECDGCKRRSAIDIPFDQTFFLPEIPTERTKETTGATESDDEDE